MKFPGIIAPAMRAASSSSPAWRSTVAGDASSASVARRKSGQGGMQKSRRMDARQARDPRRVVDAFFAVIAAGPAAAPTHLCAGATVVPVTAMKPSQANGRGPLVEVQTGTKTVCHMCPVTTTVRTNSLPNGRGTWTTTEVTKTGVEHTCTNCAAVATL